ncbi:MAG: hypothetical protein HRT36_00160 [Alphaproteobacteria bacterium]|nr:hypothetical protein [Alphaproteobacteria bacterium]
MALETTGNFAWFCDVVRPCIGRIVAVNPGQFQMIRQSVKRTDHDDAWALAFLLSQDVLSETRLKFVAERPNWHRWFRPVTAL